MSATGRGRSPFQREQLVHFHIPRNLHVPLPLPVTPSPFSTCLSRPSSPSALPHIPSPSEKLIPSPRPYSSSVEAGTHSHSLVCSTIPHSERKAKKLFAGSIIQSCCIIPPQRVFLKRAHPLPSQLAALGCGFLKQPEL